VSGKDNLMLKNIKYLLGENYQKFRKVAALSVIDIFVGVILFMMMMYVIALALSEESLSLNQLMIFTVIMLSSLLFRKFFLEKVKFNFHEVGCVAIKDLRLRIGDHLQKINLGYFNEKSIGCLVSALTTEMHDLEVIVTHYVMDLLHMVVLGVFLTVCSFVLLPQMAIYQLFLVSIALATVLVGIKKIVREGQKNRATVAALVSEVVEYVEGMQFFKSFGIAGQNFVRLMASLQKLRKSNMKTEFSLTPNLIVARILLELSFPLFLLLGIGQLINGVQKAISIICFLMVNLILTTALKAGLPKYVLCRYLALAVANITTLEKHPEMPYSLNEVTPPNFDIEFNGVTFSYGGGNVLDNVSFSAKTGETTALVGPSGAGKTTVTNLIARFWDTRQGTVTIGGTDVREISPNGLLKQISMVFQDVYLLNDSVFENIRIGSLHATDEEVMRVAKLANCHDFIMKLEHGYETVIGEGGFTLSAGERQRISIARALLKNAPIVLLDEATASLDADNEAEIQGAIKKLTQNKTVIVIAHRLNTIREADQIVVLNGGKIAEQGTHEALMANKGWYYCMHCQMQKAAVWQLGSGKHEIKKH
jgi:ATP-binding cassette subfamily B protein IrtB